MSDRSKRSVRVLFIIASACLFCLVAGFRDLDVGTDVLVYGQPAFQAGQKYDLQGFSSISMFSEWSPLFLLYSWIMARVFGSLAGYLFAIELLIIIPVYWASWRVSEEQAYIGIAAFGLFFFPASLNMMRQMAAMSFVLLAVVASLDRKLIRFVIFIAVAILLHESAIVSILIYPLAFFAKKATPGVTVLFLLALLGLYISYDAIVNLLSSLGYTSIYLTGSYSELSGGTRSNLELTFGFALCLLSYYLFKKPGDVDLKLRAIAAIMIVGICGMWLSFYSYYLYRIGYYYLIALVVGAPLLCGHFVGTRSYRSILLIVFILLLGFYFDYFVFVGAHGVVPYVSIL